MKTLPELTHILKALIATKAAADNKTSLISSQGQAMSGYQELAEYRQLVDKLKDLLDDQHSKNK